MFSSSLIVLSAITLAISASPLNGTAPRGECTITKYDQISEVLRDCRNIVISSLSVPAKTTLDLNLKEGSKVTLEGHITFGYAKWKGPLMQIRGKGITVEGAAAHKLDGQGALYWDGLEADSKKPVFVKIEANGGSVIKNINLLNCPQRCTEVTADDLTLDMWYIDCSAGNQKGGRNTDGFDVSGSNNVVIQNSVVKNQDDCVAVNSGSNLHFSNIRCWGSRGLSLSVGLSQTNSQANTVKNVTFSDSYVFNSAIAIHIETRPDGAAGSISDVTYKNIQFSDIHNYGISIQEDSGSPGVPARNIPIKNLQLINVKGSVAGKDAMPVYILCARNGCASWKWSEVSVVGMGGAKSNSCNFKPSGFSC